MAVIGSSFFTVPPDLPLSRPDTRPIVIWLSGEHDISTDGALREELLRATAFNDAPVVIDLSNVTLLSASTLGVIIATQKRLRQRTRSLALRSPSAHVRRVISICGLDHLLGSPSAPEIGLVHLNEVVDLTDRQSSASP
jgi:anti-anti-sigma factor